MSPYIKQAVEACALPIVVRFDPWSSAYPYVVVDKMLQLKDAITVLETTYGSDDAERIKQLYLLLSEEAKERRRRRRRLLSERKE